MATYKKRSKSKVDKPGVGNNVSSTKQVFESLDQGASKTEIFINKYQKLIVGLISGIVIVFVLYFGCLLYTSPSPRDRQKSRMPSSA